jgi:hypothetical protein
MFPSLCVIKPRLKAFRLGIEEREEEKEEQVDPEDVGSFTPPEMMLRFRTFRNLTFVR